MRFTVFRAFQVIFKERETCNNLNDKGGAFYRNGKNQQDHEETFETLFKDSQANSIVSAAT